MPGEQNAIRINRRWPVLEGDIHDISSKRILSEAGLHTRLHAYGTNVEGEWEVFFAAVERCHRTLHEMGVPRVSTSIKVATRTDRDQTLEDKIHSVESKLGGRT